MRTLYQDCALTSVGSQIDLKVPRKLINVTNISIIGSQNQFIVGTFFLSFFLGFRRPNLITGLHHLIFLGKQAQHRVLLCFIDLRVGKISNEASSCPGISSRTLRFYYVAGSPGSPLPYLLDGHRKLAGYTAMIPARSCPGPVRYHWGRRYSYNEPLDKQDSNRIGAIFDHKKRPRLIE